MSLMSGTSTFQEWFAVGNLGSDPELRYTAQGQMVCNASIAVSKKYTDSGHNQREETLWFRLTIWGKQAEFFDRFLCKGCRVMVRGEIQQPRVYQDRNGNARCDTEVVVREFKPIDWADSPVSESTPTTNGVKKKVGHNQPRPLTYEETEDEIPF